MNILTFDIEDWFHILDNESTKNERDWSNYETRIHKNVDLILEILESTSTNATFFCLGWIAEKYPEVIKKISEKYEIGSHTTFHQLVYEQSRSEFKVDIDRSIKALEDITGKPITYFRAPGFSITESTKWAFEELVNLGIEVDCSVFPARRAHGGFPSFSSPKPSIVRYNGFELKELPINYVTLFNQQIIYSGGGYFRLFPYSLIKRWTSKSDYVMSYLHPRDFDFEQPVINELSLMRRIKSYVGLRGASIKLEKWLNDFDFIDIKTAVNSINWRDASVIDLTK